MSNKSKLIDLDVEMLKKGICPDCSGRAWLAGPSGGMATNYKCANEKCNSEFNICWPACPQRIFRDNDESQAISTEEVTRFELIDMEL